MLTSAKAKAYLLVIGKTPSPLFPKMNEKEKG
jgi:hypothetical protein